MRLSTYAVERLDHGRVAVINPRQALCGQVPDGIARMAQFCQQKRLIPPEKVGLAGERLFAELTELPARSITDRYQIGPSVSALRVVRFYKRCPPIPTPSPILREAVSFGDDVLASFECDKRRRRQTTLSTRSLVVARLIPSGATSQRRS